MDEGVPDAAAPAPIILGDVVGPVSNIPSDVDSVKEILEPKQDSIGSNILGFVVGFVSPPALFVISIGLLFITENWDFLILVVISGACVWPLAASFLTIIAFKQEKIEQALGALINLIIWIWLVLPFLFL